MTNEFRWGDDPGKAIEKASGPQLVEIEENVISRYLLQLRQRLQSDEELSRQVARCDPARTAKGILVASYGPEKPGTGYLLEKAAEILLDELEDQRSQDPSLYLVSGVTGRAVMPISDKDIYNPPDYVGEDGEVHKARPVLHPAISSSLTLAAHEAAKQSSLVKSGAGKLAFAHLTDPDRIVQLTKEKLSGKVEFEDFDDGPWEEIVFGKENDVDFSQAVNPQFHRVELFSSVLSQKILELCKDGKRCEIGKVSLHSGTRQKWYTVLVRVSAASENLG